MLSKLSKLIKFFTSEDDNEFSCPFTDKVVKYGKELEWNSIEAHSETHITAGFSLEEDRTQVVHIFHTGEIAEQPLIQISSPVASLKEIGDKMDKDFMNELLTLNAGAPNYKWAIETIGEDEDYLIASSDQLLNTMDLGEFATAVYAVASAADKMESRFGLDNY